MTEFLSLKDRAAVVTGGAQGIGRAIVELLAQHGANIMVADLIAEKAEETAKEIAAKTGRKIVAHAVNVADNASAKEMIDAAIEQLGKVDILVNNAGITATTSSYASRKPTGTQFWTSISKARSTVPKPWSAP